MNQKKLIMNIDEKLSNNLQLLEEKLGIKRSAIVRLAVNQYCIEVNKNG